MGKKKEEKRGISNNKINVPEKKKKVTTEDVLKEMKRLAENGITEFTSTLLRDKLVLDKESGRDQIRRIMRKLEKEGKVEISQKTEGKRKQYFYKLKKSE